ncbi:HEPN domain-containing protein [Cryobacterium cryoconiti]|uniref:RiboL-PSP-HEPN domain-containing protein n=1 Tax=Cryobacterium cryoconiti TaxID=1259239 RepID=A0A4Y8JV59_9MICO|nr:HEPN domain-containing protein [Cryobacterium cryoconiti]TFD30286.1 hypothetical protein E3T49_08235 [Cryobacterium cryoconiti]
MTGSIDEPRAETMSPDTLAVESLYEDYQGLVGDVSAKSPSGLAALNRSYHKLLLVAAASSLEGHVKRITQAFFMAHGSHEISQFVSKQVLARGYHGLFDWKAESAQPYFTSFGEACGKGFKARLKKDDQLKADHDAFMKLGNLRNLVVHNDYATYTIELTPDEVMASYRKAVNFTGRFEVLILTPESL